MGRAIVLRIGEQAILLKGTTIKFSSLLNNYFHICFRDSQLRMESNNATRT